MTRKILFKSDLCGTLHNFHICGDLVDSKSK